MSYKRLFIPIFMIFVLVISLFKPVIDTSESINNKVFRLHILANSDTSYDQFIKLKARDYILENTTEIFAEKNLDDAIDSAKRNAELIKQDLTDYLKQLGYDISVDIKILKEYFDTRVYDDFTLPAGIYNSMRITLGSGEGHNWWCIIFPQVCISSCASTMREYMTDEEMELISNKYTPKFKIIEIYEKIKERIE